MNRENGKKEEKHELKTYIKVENVKEKKANGPMMHAKYMHKLCSLLMHIPTYYNIIIIFYNDLCGFLSILLILIITLQNRKTLFYVFLRFRDLPRLKLT
jgi:hypothetical protein